jgi:hypothetical protein
MCWGCKRRQQKKKKKKKKKEKKKPHGKPSVGFRCVETFVKSPRKAFRGAVGSGATLSMGPLGATGASPRNVSRQAARTVRGL